MNPGDENLRIPGRQIIDAGVRLARVSCARCRDAGLINPGDESLRIPGGEIIHAESTLARVHLFER